MSALTIACWRWGQLFGPEYVNRFRSMFARHLHVPHRVVCVTDDPSAIDPRVGIVALPHELSDSPRCIRRLRQYDGDWTLKHFGPRFLSLDLDMVLTDDVTPLFDRPDPLVLWRVGWRENIYAGAVVLMDSGALDGLWQEFVRDPEGYARAAQTAIYGRAVAGRPWGGASDQPVLNHYLRSGRVPVADLRDGDGLTTYCNGYRPEEPPMSELRPGVRLVSFGSGNKAILDEGRHEWIRRHWL